MIRFLTPLVLILTGSVQAQTFQHLDSLSFTKPFGGADPLPQILNVSNAGATNFSFTATASTSTGGNWLSVSPSGFCCTTPYNFQVIVKAPAALLAGLYNGQVVFSTGSTSLTVLVTLTVEAPGSAFFDNMPGGLSFTGKPGSPSFASQILQVRNGGSGVLTWNLCATTFNSSTCNSSNWLTVSATSGTAPTFVTVGITTANLPGAGLTAGVFTGTLTFTSTTGAITVPISVTIGASVFEQINGLSFTKPFAGLDPLDQVLQVATPGTAFSFTASAVAATGGSWLAVSPSGFCCTTPYVLSVSVNAAVTLAAGTYTGQVFLTTGTNAIVIPVNLTIAAPGTEFLDNMPGQLSFTVMTGGPNPPPQVLQVRNGGTGNLNWTLVSSTYNNGNWLNVTPTSGAAPGFVSVSIAVANLPNAGLVAGQFVGQILFQEPDSTVTVPISVVVGASVFEQVNGITFTKPLNGANPLPQVLTMASTGTAFSFTATAISATGGSWLSVSPSGFCCTTPSILTVSANPNITLAAGIYTGQVLATSGTQSVSIPVTLIIGAPATPFFDNMPGQLSYSMKVAGPNPTSQLVQVGDGGGGTLSWTATTATADSGNWLSLSTSSGTAPSDVVISINAANLPSSGLVAGVFTGSVMFQSGNNTATIPISVAVGGNSFAQINPLSFTKIAAGANPLPQILTVSSIGSPISMTVTGSSATGGNWLTVAPTGFCCTTPSTFTIGVNAAVTLGAGTYTGEVEFTTGSRAMTVPVTLTVAAPSAPLFDNVQGAMSFSSPLGGGALASQTIQLRNAGAGALNWTAVANTSDAGNWLTVSSQSGSAPATVTIGVVTQNLPSQGLVAGVATGQVLFQSPAGNVTVPVSVELGPNVAVQPIPLTFTKSFGGGSPQTQNVQVSSNGTNFSYTASASAGNGGSWLAVSPAGFCCTTPRTNTATVTAPAAFAAGAYTGQLLFDQGGMAVIVPVYLNVQGGAPVLSITKVHNGSFTQGGTGTYTVTVSNSASAGATSGTVTVTDTAPTGLTVTAMAGPGWTCTTLPMCTTTNGLNSGQSYGAITVTVSVAPNAPASVINQASVSGGGSVSANASDTTTINPAPTTAVTNVSSSTANGTYLAGSAVSIQVTFNGLVTVTGTPQLALNSGGTANYTSGSGSTTLTFTYIVGASDRNAHLDYASPQALTLNGGAINAILALPAPGTAGSLGANSSIVIGNAPPASISNVGVFRSGFLWLLDVNGDHQFVSPPDAVDAFGGVPGDIPITGDWTGNGHTKIGIYRPSNGLFLLDSNGDGQFDAGDAVLNLGVGTQAGDVPVVGDWNGNGRTKVGLFRAGFLWILDTDGNGVFQSGIDQAFTFGGVAGDVPIVGDWDGSGKSKIGLVRQGFFWILDFNGNGTIDSVNLPGGDKAFAYGGVPGDVPVVGDWNGDGRSKVGVFRLGFFWVLDANGNDQFDGTGPGQDLAFPFGGIAGDQPVVGKW